MTEPRKAGPMLSAVRRQIAALDAGGDEHAGLAYLIETLALTIDNMTLSDRSRMMAQTAPVLLRALAELADRCEPAPAERGFSDEAFAALLTEMGVADDGRS